MAVAKTLKFTKTDKGTVLLQGTLDNSLVASFEPSMSLCRERGDDNRFRIASSTDEDGFLIDYRSIDYALCFPVIVQANVNEFLIALSRDFFFLVEKENKSEKGIANGYAPLDEFKKIASQYLNIVDDLTTGGSTGLLSAKQGAILASRAEAIYALLTSDNINLDNVQEIVDAIETVQTSLSTILVNDLTTGGTTKALTAEMGKTLKGLIDALVDVVSGKQDIANQVEVGSSQNAQASWHGKTVVFVTSCTITIPSSLVNSYIFNGVTLAGVNITWAIASPHTWLFGAPVTTTEKQIFTLTKRGSTNDILLLGV
ncbi:hypothetical protein [Flavobacterium laiguense]|uniref:Uncharacterized protein n=1 Tax=Flavobacterium laiguense TaxID=2169409 RepID=A0A2U1JWC4_9FLAO|nr:hypothetical protein [Flavobacterium laiguense]PWA09507.1 hypothetical protein DB891_07435 [Flavobacterium laiguense]